MSDSHTRWEPTALPVLYSGTMDASGLTWPKQTLVLSELRDFIPWRWTLIASAVRPALAGGTRDLTSTTDAAGLGSTQAAPCVPLATQGTSSSTLY